MNRNKKIIILVIILLLSLSIVGCSGIEIDLPNETDLEYVALSQKAEENNIHTTIKDNEEIRNIINGIKLNSKKTNTESVNDTPINVDKYIKLEFYYLKSGSSVAYVYKIKDRYYIEQPYSGIWEIMQDSYDNIDLLLKTK